MKTEHYPKQVSPDRMITTITQIFNPILHKPALENLIHITLVITTAQTFRVCELARNLPTRTKTDKAKKVRLLRMLNRKFDFDSAMQRFLAFVLKIKVKYSRCGAKSLAASAYIKMLTVVKNITQIAKIK